MTGTDSRTSIPWTKLLDALLERARLEPIQAQSSIRPFLEDGEGCDGSATGGFDLALWLAVRAPRPGWAFGLGYQQAIRRLVGRPELGLASVCVTEATGGHPSQLQTRLEVLPDQQLRLSGEKRFASQLLEAEVFLVAASTGRDAQGRNRLALVEVPASAGGLERLPMPALPMVPEVSHGTLVLSSVQLPASARLPGDGFEAYVRPFRTLEDIFVHGALLVALLGETIRRAWPKEQLPRLLSTLYALRGLAVEPPEAASTHVALAGALETAQLVMNAYAPLWALQADADARAWAAAEPLQRVAEKARALRREKALSQLTGSAG